VAVERQEAAISIQAPPETDDFSVVLLPAEVDLSNASAVLHDLLSTINRGGIHLIVDAQAVRFMDSSALNMLVRARQRTEAMNGSLHLVATSHRLRRLLEISRLDHILRRVDSVDEAIACLASFTGQHRCTEAKPAA
jgi:anti-sigma B factor antagonist